MGSLDEAAKYAQTQALLEEMSDPLTRMAENSARREARPKTEQKFDELDDEFREPDEEFFYLISTTAGGGEYTNHATLHGVVTVQANATEAEIFDAICQKSGTRFAYCAVNLYDVRPNKRSERSLF